MGFCKNYMCSFIIEKNDIYMLKHDFEIKINIFKYVAYALRL